MSQFTEDSELLVEPIDWPDWTINTGAGPRRASTSSSPSPTPASVPIATGMRRSASGGHRSTTSSPSNVRQRLLRSHNSDDANRKQKQQHKPSHKALDSGNSISRQASAPPVMADNLRSATPNDITEPVMFASPAVPNLTNLPLIRVPSHMMMPNNIAIPTTKTEKAVHMFTSLTYAACAIASLSVVITKLVYHSLDHVYPLDYATCATSYLTVSTAKYMSAVAILYTIFAPIWHVYPLSISPAYSIACLATPFLHIVFHVFSTLNKLYAKERAALERLTVNEVRAVVNQGEQLLSEAEERRTALVKMITEEIRDTSRIGKAAILRLAPSTVFAAQSREHLAACSVPVPTASMASIDAILQHIEHLSRHLESLNNPNPSLSVTDNDKESSASDSLPQFDVGELLQRVGDMMSGCATSAKVEVVIYHAEAQICHRMVYGDETRYQHMLFNLLKMVIMSAAPGDWVELGLVATPVKESTATPPIGANLPNTLTINCVFRITHSPLTGAAFTLPHLPNANENLRLITELNGQLVARESDNGLHVLDVILPLSTPTRSASSSSTATAGLSSSNAAVSGHGRTTRFIPNGPRVGQGSNTASEPSLDELKRFISTLRNRTVALYAANSSILAKHVTAWLTLWSTDISYISIDNTKLDDADINRVSANTSFVVIDDDTATLERVLRYLCTNPVPPTKEHRPPNSRNRARSVPANGGNNENADKTEEYASGTNAPTSAAAGGGGATTMNNSKSTDNSHDTRPNVMLPGNNHRSVIHFTSIGRYQEVKQVVADVFSNLPTFPLFVPPQILVIPKPIGPRRFLTALHTAVTRPHMDTLSYIPIATSPATPGLWTLFNGEIEQNPMERAMDTRSATADARIYSGMNGQSTNGNVHSPGSAYRHVVNRTRMSHQTNGHHTNGVLSPVSSQGSTTSNNGMMETAAAATAATSTAATALSGSNTSGNNGNTNGTNTNTTTTNNNGNSNSNGGLRISSSLAQSTMHNPSTPSPKLRPNSPLLPNRMNAAAPSPKQISNGLSSPSAVITNPMEKAISTGTSNGNNGGNGSGAVESRTLSTRKKWMRQSNTGERASGGLSTSALNKSGFVSPPIKVLIVEDNPINQTILSTFLRKRKIEYAVASDGREAVEKWKNGGFHLVLMDIQLPVLDGIEATKEIRRFEKERKAAALSPTNALGGEVSGEQRRLTTQLHTPVIIVALTASALQADRNTALAAGCNDFLTKPVSLPWLEKKITEWGCMQALINVNSWSRWRRQDAASPSIASPSSTSHHLHHLHHRNDNGSNTPTSANISRSNSEKKT
ncbi:hypothetical protein BDF22DRAFT_653315 [Syncephalis plumigaleata]|nr:hypothetical protein BDF22DRAFT_653315 [Syncephalis plumigaleata]